VYESDHFTDTFRFDQAKGMVGAYMPDALNPLQRTVSTSSSSSTQSSVESFASAEQFNDAPGGLPVAGAKTPPSDSQHSLLIPDDSPHGREMQKIEERKRQLKEKLDQVRERQEKESLHDSEKTQKEIDKATEKHEKEKKKQEEKFEKEIRKLDERREKETRKLLARRKKEEDKDQLLKAQRERDEHKQRVDILEHENKLLKEQLGGLQKENTALIVRLGKTDVGRDILRLVHDDLPGRARADSRASARSGKSGRSKVDLSETGLPT
jgi:flagellar biosynthesis GTPase FlhF